MSFDEKNNNDLADANLNETKVDGMKHLCEISEESHDLSREDEKTN